jgi:hypothetical protein
MPTVKTKKFRNQATTGAGTSYDFVQGVVLDWKLTTGGNGDWSNEERTVAVTGVALLHCENDYDENDADDFELRICFNTRSWNNNRHGLIYTDSRWMRELIAHFNKLGLPGRAVDYTEQGMQGDNYVSCCVDKKQFLTTWRKLGFPINEREFE